MLYSQYGPHSPSLYSRHSQKRHPKGIKTVSECKKIMNTPSPFLLTLFPPSPHCLLIPFFAHPIFCSSHFLLIPIFAHPRCASSLTHLYTYFVKDYDMVLIVHNHSLKPLFVLINRTVCKNLFIK